MSGSTAGIRLNIHNRRVSDAVELLSSMRFAISLLTLISIASIIGTVLKQNEPMANYVNQFGPFWFTLFDHLGLYTVYSAWWFLLIMSFLVVSTSLCIVRNAPKMLKDARSWRENVREQSLRNFHHKMEWRMPQAPGAASEQMAQRVAAQGYKVKQVDKDGATLITAKRGAASKWGYIFAHSAIVIICVGGLLDSELPLRAQQWLHDKTPFGGSGLIADVPARHRIGVSNPSFRANVLIPEGGAANTAIIPQQDGVLIQELPITIRLERFIIEFYSTGMPKLFASEVVVTDHQTGHSFPADIRVNHPLIYKGLAIYQSSFDDGGSKLKVTGFPMTGSSMRDFSMDGVVGGESPLVNASGEEYTIEWSGFRPFNVENMASAGQDLRAVDTGKRFNSRLLEQLDSHLGSAGKNTNTKDLKNVGPSVSYKIRDKTGQAREFHNFMLPVTIDDTRVFLAGVRNTPAETFRYLRIPADEEDSVVEWMRLRAALLNPQMRQAAARRYAETSMSEERNAPGNLRAQLEGSALRGLEIFAGNARESGYIAISRFLEGIPVDEQEKAATIFMKILNGSLWELWQVARVDAGLDPAPAGEKEARFLQLAANAYADSFFYGAPVFLQLEEFEEIKASVLQVTRSPGKNIVYLGCLLLVLGIFAMLYIRERRLWIWIKPDPEGNSQAIMAMSAQRRTFDFDQEFESIKKILVQPTAKQGS